jgi:hypothetical protein
MVGEGCMRVESAPFQPRILPCVMVGRGPVADVSGTSNMARVGSPDRARRPEYISALDVRLVCGRAPPHDRPLRPRRRPQASKALQRRTNEDIGGPRKNIRESLPQRLSARRCVVGTAGRTRFDGGFRGSVACMRPAPSAVFSVSVVLRGPRSSSVVKALPARGKSNATILTCLARPPERGYSGRNQARP